MKKKALIIGAAVASLAAIITALCIGTYVSESYVDPNLDLSDVPPALDPDTQKFIIKAGVNLPGLETGWSFYSAPMKLSKKSVYTNIKDQGFDHVRIPIDFRRFYSAENDAFDEDWIKKYDKILDLAESTGLYVMIDFHGWIDIDPSSESDEKLFLRLWELVAERYRNRSNYVIFELMSEPSLKTVSSNELNDLQSKAIEIIRKSNPERLIICAAPDANQPWLLDELVLPENDKNLAVAVHIYHPGDFTHQGYTWAGREKGVQVKLTYEHLSELRWNINKTKEFIGKTKIPVILNEFGMNLEISREKDRYAYLGEIAEFCNECDIPWTFWRYDGEEMSLYSRGKWKTDILDVLFCRE